MAKKLPTTATEVSECIQDAARVLEHLELDGLLARTGMLRARRNALARAIKKRPERATRYAAQLTALSAHIEQADDLVLARAVEIKSRPASSKGFAMSGRTVDDRGAAMPSMTVAVLGSKGEVITWTASDIGGWYALAVEDAEGAALVQVSDERGTVISQERLEGVTMGSRLRRDFTVPGAKTKGTAPPQSKGGPTKVDEPAGVVRRRDKERDARAAELQAARDAKAKLLATRKSAIDALDRRAAELKASQAEVTAAVKRLRGRVSRSRTALQKLKDEMDAQESEESAKYKTLAKQREARADKLVALEAELHELVAHESALVEAGTKLATEREAAAAAFSTAKDELAAVEAEVTDFQSGAG